MAHALPLAEPAAGDPALPAYAAGDLLNGRYRLLSRIGEGGMATVWRAHSLTVGRDVAVKLIRRDRESPEAIARLHVEACAASAIEHPSIVRVFDFGETTFGDPFLVMELLEGESLSGADEPTMTAPIPAIDRPRSDPSPAPILATPARRDNVTTTPAVTRRSPALVVIAVIAVAVLAAILLRRAAPAPAHDEPRPPVGALAP